MSDHNISLLLLFVWKQMFSINEISEYWAIILQTVLIIFRRGRWIILLFGGSSMVSMSAHKLAMNVVVHTNS